MGRRGPPKTPTLTLKNRGSWRGKARKNEPEPIPSIPKCPSCLSTVARRVWAELIPQLAEMNILGRCDRNALTRYCQMFAEWQSAEAFLAKHEEMRRVRDKAGRFTKTEERPQVRRAERLSKQLLALERQFGLTPSARADLAQPVHSVDENRGKNRFFPKSA